MGRLNIGVVYRMVLVVSGLILVYFGLNNIFGWVRPAPSTAEAAELGMALRSAGYFFPVVSGVFIVSGLSLILNLWVPFALIVLAPITVNIILFHLVLAPMNMLLSFLLLMINLGLAIWNRKYYKGLFVISKP